MDVIFIPLLWVCGAAINLYWWAVVIYVILQLLEQFNIINRYNQFVYNLHTFLFRLVEPALTPIRRILPNLGTIDLSPMVLILFLYFLQGVLAMLALKFPH